MTTRDALNQVLRLAKKWTILINRANGLTTQKSTHLKYHDLHVSDGSKNFSFVGTLPYYRPLHLSKVYGGSEISFRLSLTHGNCHDSA